jgi:hypothetical protein
MRRSVVLLMLVTAVVSAGASPAKAREWPAADANECSADHFHVNDLVSYAELREQRLPNGSTNYINPGQNGSIRVHGWNNSDVLVRACIQAAAPNDSEARALAAQVTIARGAGMIEADGPPRVERQYWNVSYEIWTPNASNLDLKANNGSIRIEAVEGQIRFHTQNGSVHLSDVAGDVEGSTTNGSLTINLAGNTWKGNGLRAQTTNGSVRLNLPANFSAQVEASTVNGRVMVDFPVTVSGKISKNMSLQIGSGGPLIEAKTVNGSVRISRRA